MGKGDWDCRTCSKHPLDPLGTLSGIRCLIESTGYFSNCYFRRSEGSFDLYYLRNGGLSNFFDYSDSSET